MEFIFGNVFICKDMNVAKTVTFHDRIKKKCVTLDGDITDPSGTLSGGAAQKGGSVLVQLNEIQEYEVKKGLYQLLVSLISESKGVIIDIYVDLIL